MKRVSSRLAQAGLSALFVLLLAAHVAGLIHIAPMQRAEAWLYDAWLKRTAPAGLDDRVAILDIDEASLKSVGRWPWSRDTMTTLVEQLFDRYGVAAVGFDVVFAEPDTSSGLDSLQTAGASAIWRAAAIFRRRSNSLRRASITTPALPRRWPSVRCRWAITSFPQGYGDAKTGMLPPPSLPAAAFRPLQPGTAAHRLWRESGGIPACGAGRGVFQHAGR